MERHSVQRGAQKLWICGQGHFFLYFPFRRQQQAQQHLQRELSSPSLQQEEGRIDLWFSMLGYGKLRYWNTRDDVLPVYTQGRDRFMGGYRKRSRFASTLRHCMLQRLPVGERITTSFCDEDISLPTAICIGLRLFIPIFPNISFIICLSKFLFLPNTINEK